MSKTVAVIGALDTKGRENAYLVEKLKERGLGVIVIDLGILGEPYFTADYPGSVVASRGGMELSELRAKMDRALGLDVMSSGALAIVKELIAEKKIDGICALGGGQGTYMATTILKELPVGFPKVLASTTAFSGIVREAFDNLGDTFVANSIVDIESLNSRLRETIVKVAAVLDALVNVEEIPPTDAKGTVAITMWGITTKCGDRVAHTMEDHGYEVMVFHATGDGGNVMEQLVEQGRIDCVIDLTTAEVSHEVLENAIGWRNHTRLTTAGKCGVPQVVIPGGLDAINLENPHKVPDRWENQGRKFHMHNSSMKVMRTTKEDLIQVGEVMGDRLAAAKGKTAVLLPLKGLSANDVEGGDFYEPEADAALFETLHRKLDGKVDVIDMPYAVNDPEFADKIAETALRFLES